MADGTLVVKVGGALSHVPGALDDVARALPSLARSRPVLVIPGFTATDASTAALRFYILYVLLHEQV